MKLAVISDIHGNIAALDAVLADISRRKITRIVNLGDCLSGPFDAVATAERLMSLNIATVCGNHDRELYDRSRGQMGLWESWIIGDLEPKHLTWIKSLPPVLEIEGVLLCHGTPSSDEENWLDEKSQLNRLLARDLDEVVLRAGGVSQQAIACGHTHMPRIVRLPDGRLIVNPGSVGCPAYLDTRFNPPFIHQTGAPDARYAVLENVGGRWQADLHAVPYDVTGMVRLAKKRGASSWVQALATGWFV